MIQNAFLLSHRIENASNSSNTTSGTIGQIESETLFGKTALILPTPLAKAPFNASKGAPLYLLLPAITRVLPRLYLLALGADVGNTNEGISFFV